MKPKLPQILVLTLLFIMPARAQRQAIESRWHDQSIQNLTLADFQTEKSILYLISNNADYLYLNLVVPGSIEQKKILLYGMTLSVEQKGKTEKDIDIMYPFRMTDRMTKQYGPVPEGADPLRGNPEDGRAGQNFSRRAMANFEGVKHDLINRSRMIGLVNYADTADQIIIPSTNLQEVHGWMAYDSMNMLHYIITIPFEKIPLNDTDSKSGFNIRLETGYSFTEQSMSAQGGRGRPGGGSGGGRGGGMERSGGPPGGGGGRPSGGGGRSGGGQGQVTRTNAAYDGSEAGAKHTDQDQD